MDATDAQLRELRSQVAHWRTAATGLSDLENFASDQAWRALDDYLGLAVRRHLQEAVTSVVLELDAVSADLRTVRSAADLARVQQRVVRFRRRYLQIETVLEFFGHAVRSRTTTRLGELLRACDLLAVMAMTPALRPLRLEVPPALVYLDRGLGASILRAGLRLWDGGSVSPAAAIKITRFNLYRPTSLLHEVGHQVAHLTAWNTELPVALRQGVPDRTVADVWAGWATELGPDFFAFAHTGYGAVAALHDVVAGESRQVFAHPLGDPHPIAWLRVLVGVEMCVRSYGSGPWDELRAAWLATHPLEGAPAALQPLLARSVAQLPRIVEIGLRSRMRAFGGRSLTQVVDPARVSPAALQVLARETGPALTRSPHLLRTEALRLLAISSLDIATDPERAGQITREFETWMRRLATLAPLRTAA